MTYPIDVQSLAELTGLNSPKYFALGTLEQQDADGAVINILPDGPIAVNDAKFPYLRAQIQQATDVKLPTRNEVSNGPRPDDLTHSNIDWQNTGTVAAGMAIWLQSENLPEPLLYVAKNGSQKPVNPGRVNIPSNLLRMNPHDQAMAAANGDTTLLIPSQGETHLIGMKFKPPREFNSLDVAFQESVLDGFYMEEEKHANIHARLQEMNSPYAGLPIHYYEVPMQIRTNDPVQETTVNFMGEVTKALAHVYYDRPLDAINVNYPVDADLDALPDAKELDFSKMIAVRPLKFGAQHALLTLDKAYKQATQPVTALGYQTRMIEAPASYIKQIG